MLSFKVKLYVCAVVSCLCTADFKLFRLEQPDRLRATPNGGRAWKCCYCNRYASSQSQTGKYVCYAHGGVRQLARDPVARVKAKEQGETPPRPPGRPMTHGFYAGGERVKVDELVAAYKAQGLDPDDTTDDLLYLRAYLNDLMTLRPCVSALKADLHLVQINLAPFQALVLADADGLTLDTLMTELPQLSDLAQLIERTGKLYSQLERFTAGLEARHAQIITLAKVRAETRLKNKAASELTVFSEMLNRLNQVLFEAMPPEAYRALQKRFERDLNEISKRQLECVTVSVGAGKD